MDYALGIASGGGGASSAATLAQNAATFEESRKTYEQLRLQKFAIQDRIEKLSGVKSGTDDSGSSLVGKNAELRRSCELHWDYVMKEMVGINRCIVIMNASLPLPSWILLFATVPSLVVSPVLVF